jgi:N-acetylmuramoyl-L-alanine amidase
MRAAVVLASLAFVAKVHARPTVEAVEVVREPALAVRVRLSAPVHTTAHTLPPEGDRPDRVYLDLPGTSLGRVALPPVDGVAPLRRVRTAQFDAATVRVVLDLDAPVPFEVRRDDTTITIALGAPPPAPIARRPSLPPRVAPPARLVVLDAGHGGRDPGATGPGGLTEKTITLDLAHRVAERLASHEALEVLLTRTDDTFVPIDARIACAAEAALFVSLHANAAADETLSGVEVFYGGGGLTAAASGPRSPVRLGFDVVEAFERRLSDVRTVVRPGSFGVLARNAVPSVLVEIGYLTNATDAARLQDETYRRLVAEAIAEGATRFLEVRLKVAAR